MGGIRASWCKKPGRGRRQAAGCAEVQWGVGRVASRIQAFWTQRFYEVGSIHTKGNLRESIRRYIGNAVRGFGTVASVEDI